jgi:hypothetical protein
LSGPTAKKRVGKLKNVEENFHLQSFCFLPKIHNREVSGKGQGGSFSGLSPFSLLIFISKEAFFL